MNFMNLMSCGHYERKTDPDGEVRRHYIPPTEMEKAVHNVAIAEMNQAIATVESTEKFGMFFSETMNKFGDTICNQLANIADEMQKTRLTQEYFGIMEKIFQSAAVLDEKTVRSNLEKLQNVKLEKMTEQEIMFLVVNFGNKELCRKIKELSLKKGISAYEVGKELLKSAVIVEKIWKVYSDDYLVDVGKFYFCIKNGNSLENLSILYFSDFMTKGCGRDYTALRCEEIEGYFQSNSFFNNETDPTKKVWSIIYSINPGYESKIQEKYLDLWKQNAHKFKKESYIEWQTAYCQWEEFEKEVEFNNMMKLLRKIAFDMQHAAILARFNPK